MNRLEREALRRAWERSGDDDAHDHLTARLGGLDALFTVLPADPYGVALPEFDADARDWWQQITGKAPFGSPLRWEIDASTVDQLVRARRRGDGWSTYLALHRHGGISLGTSLAAYEHHTSDDRRQRNFRLCKLVGLSWIVADVQAHVIERLSPDGPWELRLHLYESEGAGLADLAEAWPEPSAMWEDEVPRASTEEVVVRHELDVWPKDDDGIKALATRIGGNVEDAFGTGLRRFVANRGEREGDVDLRRWQL